MPLENVKKVASVVFTAFLGGFLGFILPILGGGVVPPENQWRGIALGAVSMGIAAVVHLYQAPPAGSAAATAMAAKLGRSPDSTRGFARARPLAALALLAVLSVSIAPAFLASGLVACTPAQAANDVKITGEVMTDAQKACVDIVAAMPTIDAALNLPPPSVADVDDVCGIVGVADAIVQNAIATGTAAAPAAVKKARGREIGRPSVPR